MKSFWAARARIIPNTVTVAQQQCCRNITTRYEHNLLAEAVTERDVVRYLGPDYQRNYKLEALVRMIADHLIAYETMDNTLNQRRLELYSSRSLGFDDEYRKNSALESLRDVYLHTGVVINQPLLDSLSIDLINQTHSSMTTSMKLITEDVYHKYLNRVILIPGSGPLIPVKDRGTESYRIRSLKATEKMNKRLIQYMNVNFSGREPAFFGDGKEINIVKSSSVQQGSFFLKGIADILIDSHALPNLKTFNLLIRQLNAYRLSVPARMVTDALLFSGLQLNGILYNTMLKLAISTSDKSLFMKLAAVIDCNSVSVSSSEQGTPLTPAYWDVFNPLKMSSYKNHDWQKPTLDDVKFGCRFFEENLISIDETRDNSSSVSSIAKFNLNEGMFSVKLFTTLISGLVRFGWFWWVDVAIRKMTAEGFPLTLEVLTQNMQAATSTKDSAKIYWTWTEMLKLPLPSAPSEIRCHTARDRNGFVYDLKPFDYESFVVCTNAARAIKNKKLEAEIAAFYKEVLYFKVNLSLKENKDSKKTPLRIPFFTFTSQPKNTVITEREEEIKNLESGHKSVKAGHASGVVGGNSLFKLERVQLPAAYKNASGIMNGGSLLWDPVKKPADDANGYPFRLATSQPREGRKPASLKPKRWFDNL